MGGSQALKAAVVVASVAATVAMAMTMAMATATVAVATKFGTIFQRVHHQLSSVVACQSRDAASKEVPRGCLNYGWTHTDGIISSSSIL